MVPVLTDLSQLRTGAVAPLRARDLLPLERAVAGHDPLGALHVAAELAACARHTVGDPETHQRLDALVTAGGAGAAAAVEIIGALIGDVADERLMNFLAGGDPLLRRHASWRLGARTPLPQAIPALVIELQRGGIDTFHAHRTLRHWSRSEPAAVLRAAATALAVIEDPASRARTIDLLGAVDDRGTDEFLVDLAVDPFEHEAGRIAAIGALADRPGPTVDEALMSLVGSDDVVGAHAALALQRTFPDRGGSATTLHVAQLVLAEGLDGQLSRGGCGETGGVASLLVSLGNALGGRPEIGHVATIGRGSVTDALVGPFVHGDRPWSFGSIPLGDPIRQVSGAGDAWEHLPALERGLRRSLRLAGRIDLLHLRMADVGTLVGAEVAVSEGIPTCFSLAPDPHHVIQSLHSRGELDTRAFERLELDQHVWLRARMVEDLGRAADRVALFPRATSFPFVDDIVADDARSGIGRRTAVVAEGIDIEPLRRAEHESVAPAVIHELDDRITERRRGLPLLVTVGRLHPVKGMERVVEAWASCPQLRNTCNLVIVGGDLRRPSTAERTVLERIDEILDRRPDVRDGVVLLGGRPHADIARLLVGARRGRSDAWASGGVYVDGAVKEEFGLAVLEAMAAGLVVVAPSTGGPATYVEPGDTGVLVGPGDDLSTAISQAFGLVDRPGRPARSRALVEAHYSIGTMAAQLVDLYRAEAA